jgi:hypothetical protein
VEDGIDGLFTTGYVLSLERQHGREVLVFDM